MSTAPPLLVEAEVGAADERVATLLGRRGLDVVPTPGGRLLVRAEREDLLVAALALAERRFGGSLRCGPVRVVLREVVGRPSGPAEVWSSDGSSGLRAELLPAAGVDPVEIDVRPGAQRALGESASRVAALARQALAMGPLAGGLVVGGRLRVDDAALGTAGGAVSRDVVRRVCTVLLAGAALVLLQPMIEVVGPGRRRRREPLAEHLGRSGSARGAGFAGFDPL